jgi:LmbE family N-acetylglucosaminyl deacetylase
VPARYGSPLDERVIDLELGELAEQKLAAIARHVSQTGSDGPFAGWDPATRDRFLAHEHYRLVRSNLPAAASADTELFAGLV